MNLDELQRRLERKRDHYASIAKTRPPLRSALWQVTKCLCRIAIALPFGFISLGRSLLWSRANAQADAAREAERLDRLRNPRKFVGEYRNPERVSGK